MAQGVPRDQTVSMYHGGKNQSTDCYGRMAGRNWRYEWNSIYRRYEKAQVMKILYKNMKIISINLSFYIKRILFPILLRISTRLLNRRLTISTTCRLEKRPLWNHSSLESVNLKNKRLRRPKKSRLPVQTSSSKTRQWKVNLWDNCPI